MTGRGYGRRKSETVQDLRRRIWTREKGICCICRFPVAWEHASIEHLNPLSNGGGSYGRLNRRISHKWCNSARGSGPLVTTESALARTHRSYHRYPGLTWFPGSEPPLGKLPGRIPGRRKVKA